MPQEPVSVEIDGVVHHGTYRVEDKRLMVQSDFGGAFAFVGTGNHEAQAKLLLHKTVVRHRLTSGSESN